MGQLHSTCMYSPTSCTSSSRSHARRTGALSWMEVALVRRVHSTNNDSQWTTKKRSRPSLARDTGLANGRHAKRHATQPSLATHNPPSLPGIRATPPPPRALRSARTRRGPTRPCATPPRCCASPSRRTRAGVRSRQGTAPCAGRRYTWGSATRRVSAPRPSRRPPEVRPKQHLVVVASLHHHCSCLPPPRGKPTDL
jgi:hypothetical protein